MKNHIIVDSGCDLNKDLINSEDCTVTSIPINLQIEDKVYLDDANFDQDAYLDAMEASAVAVKTAAPSPQLFLDAFTQGDNVFAVTLSSKLSATYQSAMTAKDMYLDEYGKKFIHVFDSLSASVGETAVALKIAELLKTGLGTGEVIEQVNQFIKGMRTYFIIDTFENLVKTGRIKPYVAKIASLLNVKPICGDENGEIKMVDKARGYTKALGRLVKIIKESTPDIESRIISITHVKAYEKAVALKNALLEQVNAKGIIIHESNGATTTYGGRGGIVIAL